METHFPDLTNANGQLARDRVITDLKNLAADADALLRATAGDAGEKAAETRARLSAAIEKARATCSQLQARGIASARQAAEGVDDTIREHPYQAIAVALGVGLLLGALLRRKAS